MMTMLKIFILHGWAVDPDNVQKWEAFRSQLHDQGIETHFLALPGLTTPLTTAWDLSDYVKWLNQQLEGYSDVILLGHSFGGQIAVRYTSLHPTQIKFLILLDAAGIRDQHPLIVIKRFIFAIGAKIGKKFTKSTAARALLYKIARERDYLEASPIMQQTMNAVLADEILQNLPTINCPTLVVWGEQDRVTPLRLAHQFMRHLPNATLRVIESARHSPQFTHPAQTAHSIIAFLESKSWE